MARRTPDFSRVTESTVASSPPEPVASAPESAATGDDVPTGDASTSAPTLVVAEPATPELVAEVPPTDPLPVERYRVETSVYYVPSLGYGAVFVPAGTIITRVSHDLQKLVAQGAQLRPLD